jgi:hypothetical protein
MRAELLSRDGMEPRYLRPKLKLKLSHGPSFHGPLIAGFVAVVGVDAEIGPRFPDGT